MVIEQREALFQTAKSYYKNYQYDKACDIYSSLSDEGHLESMFFLAQDFVYPGSRCYHSLVSRGRSPTVSSMLPQAEFTGNVDIKSSVAGIQLAATAAKGGNAKAQNLLGQFYARNRTQDLLVFDKKKAREWYKKSAENGNYLGQYHLAYSYEREGDKKSAFKWYLEAAKQGYVSAQYDVVVAYSNGVGVAADRSQTTYWLGQMAQQDHDVKAKKWALRQLNGR